jgi:hypothetical protein
MRSGRLVVNSHQAVMADAADRGIEYPAHGMHTLPLRWSRRRWLFVPAAAAMHVLAASSLSAQPAAPRVDATALSARVDDLLREHGQGIEAGLWLGGAAGAAAFERDATTPRATASAIKTFYLVELFGRFAGALDRPLPGVDVVLADDAHPAIGHFTPEQRAEIRGALNGATVRRVALAMMGTAPASNIVYNAAANVVTAVLGGPDALTALIRQRDPAFAVSVRRYMLRDRHEHGDNEAPPIALAALYQRLAARRLAGIDAATMDAIREALRRADDPVLGRHYDKNGDLDTDPLTMARAGWYETAGGPLVYVVMTTQPTPGPSGREASSEQLAKTADALAHTIVQAGRAALP